jgi:hypothetical protein
MTAKGGRTLGAFVASLRAGNVSFPEKVTDAKKTAELIL